MKKLGIITLMLIFSVSAFAQKGKINLAKSKLDQGKVKEAYETLKAALDAKDEKTMAWPNTWITAGQIYSALGKDDNTKNVVSDPFGNAAESFLKAMEVDEKGRSLNQLKLTLTLFKSDVYNEAVKKYDAKDYKGAFKLFQEIEKIDKSPALADAEAIDTALIYNTGVTGFYAELYEECIPYFNEAAEKNYNKNDCYQFIGESFAGLGKGDEAIKFFSDAFKKDPSNIAVLNALTNVYNSQGKSEEAVKYLDLAIKQDPTNKTYYLVMGVLQEKLKDTDAAIKYYQKAIEVDKEYYEAYYSIGVLHYNNGVAIDQEIRDLDINDTETYNQLRVKSGEEFKSAIPLFEKAYELKPDDKSSVENLKSIYYRVGDMDKYKEMETILGK